MDRNRYGRELINDNEDDRRYTGWDGGWDHIMCSDVDGAATGTTSAQSDLRGGTDRRRVPSFVFNMSTRLLRRIPKFLLE